ncbi:MAG: GC-type dockerin domain-anchored protein [Phycisphaerales bacterium]
MFRSILLVLILCTSPAVASPRETLAWTSVSSGSTATLANGENALGLNGVQVRTGSFAGGYTVRRLVISGSLFRNNASSLSSEAVIVALPPGGRPPIVMRPWSANDFSAGGQAVLPPGGVGFNLAQEFNPQGAWAFKFAESYQNGPASSADSMWGSITITTDDDPAQEPFNIPEIGSLAATLSRGPEALPPGGLLWYRVTLPEASPKNHGYVDIDTEGSTLAPANATLLALFNAQGVLMASDLVDGSGSLSQLTFGARAGTRAAVGGQPYNGRDGYLAAGAYYVVVTSAGGTVGTSDWAVGVTGNNSGTVVLNLRAGERAASPVPTARDLHAIGNARTIPGPTEDPLSVGEGQPLWLRFSLEQDARHAAGTYMDIDFESTVFAAGDNDPKVAVYTDRGLLITTDNNDGTESLPLLSFGQVAPARPPIGSGVTRTGQDGPLYAGAYYLVVVGNYGGATFNDGFAVGPSGHGFSNVVMHIHGNVLVGPRACNPADISGLGGDPAPDGVLTVDDLVAYLSSFFSGNLPMADIATLGGAAIPDGVLTIDDLVQFLAQFFSPCFP